MTAPRAAFVKKRLLRLLYLAAIIPMTLLFVLSSGIVLWQEISLRGEIADYAAALARDVGSCFDGNRTGDLAAYKAFLDDTRPDKAGAARKLSVIPGRAALFRRSGEVLWASKGGEVLRDFLATPPGKPAVIVRDGSPDFGTSALAVRPTNDPDVLAAASVSFHAWRAGKGVLALHVAMYALGTALFCIAFLQLLKRWLFSPLHALAEEIRSIRWGRDIPRPHAAPNGLLSLEIEEVREADHGPPRARGGDRAFRSERPQKRLRRPLPPLALPRARQMPRRAGGAPDPTARRFRRSGRSP